MGIKRFTKVRHHPTVVKQSGWIHSRRSWCHIYAPLLRERLVTRILRGVGLRAHLLSREREFRYQPHLSVLRRLYLHGRAETQPPPPSSRWTPPANWMVWGSLLITHSCSCIIQWIFTIPGRRRCLGGLPAPWRYHMALGSPSNLTVSPAATDLPGAYPHCFTSTEVRQTYE